MTRGYGKGRSPTRFHFTYESLSEVSGLSVAAVRKHAQRGSFNPKDLLSVLEFVNHRLQRLDLTEDKNQVDSVSLIKKLELVRESGKCLPGKSNKD